MRKRQMKKLALNRETVLNLSPENLAEIQGAAQIQKWSEPPMCDPACTSQTLSCTL
ncbi:MAG TPA: class I lanthipeptide [Thermoanaerobaculia bacterium]|nr:class I lanthipeptide [Thermoanaerobaculia bacterium]